MAQTIKSLPAMQETRLQSLGQKDSPGERNATHFIILAWRIPWAEEFGGSWGRKESDMTTLSFFLLLMVSLILLWSEKTGCIILKIFLSPKVSSVHLWLLSLLRIVYDLTWRMLYVHWRSVYILQLLSEVFLICL